MCQKESWGAIVATKEAHSTQKGQPPRMHGENTRKTYFLVRRTFIINVMSYIVHCNNASSSMLAKPKIQHKLCDSFVSFAVNIFSMSDIWPRKIRTFFHMLYVQKERGDHTGRLPVD